MQNFEEYLAAIENIEHREKMRDLFDWILTEFPELETRIAWNQPMFTHHETFILAFSLAKNHISVSPEVKTLTLFAEDIDQSGYDHTNNIFRIKWTQAIDRELIKKLISFNIEDKKDYHKFWR